MYLTIFKELGRPNSKGRNPKRKDLSFWLHKNFKLPNRQYHDKSKKGKQHAGKIKYKTDNEIMSSVQNEILQVNKKADEQKAWTNRK